MAVAHDAIDTTNRRIAAAIDALPPLDSATFWDEIERRGTLAPEVLVYLIRRFRAAGRANDVSRAADALLAFAYPVVQGIVRRTLLSRPQDHEDAICETIALMWRHIAEGVSSFWERNALGALHAVTISVCRTFFAKKRTIPTFSDLARPDSVDGADDPGAYLPSAAASQEEPQLLGRLVYERLLTGLDPAQRTVVRLLVEEELTQREIAQRLGCTEKTVYNRIGRVRDLLRVALAADEDDEKTAVSPLSSFDPDDASRMVGVDTAHEQPAATARCR